MYSVTATTTTFEPREFHSARMFAGAIWVMGGNNGSYSPLADAWSTVNGNQWTPHSVPWLARTAHASFAFTVRVA